MRITRRTAIVGLGSLVGARALAGCAGNGTKPAASMPQRPPSGWRMPSEEDPHERTWMCWPSNADVWGRDLVDVQDAIVRIALAISEFEPVSMLARDAEIDALTDLVGGDVELIAAPVDDLWARDTLPNFIVAPTGDGGPWLAAAHARFNGWGGKQVHSGDTQLAELVAAHLGIDLFDSGLVGEGGGIEVDGLGTVLASESCWVNDNRNPAMSRDEIEAAILAMLGADRMLWVPGLADFDITDGHIDTLARFVGATTILLDRPSVDDPDDPWATVAEETRTVLSDASMVNGQPYSIEEIAQPLDIRGGGDEFLSTYMNFYVCNGAVIAPEFGDTDADAAAAERLGELFPDRETVMLDIDALAAGGGGIHCATQQQPSRR
jgi:agmatine deiminase